jgi:hypothetical protein
MKEEEPQLPIEITNLNNMLAKHRTSIDNIEKKIKDVIKERLSSMYQSPLKIGNSFSYDFNYVYIFLKKVWEGNDYELKEIDNYINRATPRIQNGFFYFENIPVDKGKVAIDPDLFPELLTEMRIATADEVLRDENVTFCPK